MAYDPYLINRIKGAVRARDVAKVEELWVELQSSQTLEDLNLFLELAGEVADRGDKERAAELLLLLREDLKGQGREDDLFELLRRAVNYSARVRDVREDLVAQYRRLFGDRPGFDAVLSKSDLAGEGSLREAVALLDQSFAFSVGDYVFHSRGWGIGRVAEAHPETGEFVIDFASRRGQVMEAGMARKALEKRSKDDLDVLLWTDKDRVRALAEENPLGLLKAALNAAGGKLTSALLREKLTDILEKSAWTKFWSRARKLAKDDPTLEIGSGARATISVRTTPLSRDDEVVEAMRKTKDFRKRLEMACSELAGLRKDTPTEPPAWLAPALEMLSERHGKSTALESQAAQLEEALFRDEAASLFPSLIPGYQKSDAVDPETGEPLPGASGPLRELIEPLQPEQVTALLHDLSLQDYRRRVVHLLPRVHKNEAARYLRAVLLDPAPGTWLAAVAALKEHGLVETIVETAKDLVIRPHFSPHAFAAFARAHLGRQVDILPDRRDAEILAKAIQVLDSLNLHHRDVTTRTKAIAKITIDSLRSLFTEKSQRVLERVIGEGTEDEVRRVLLLVRQSPALTDLVRRATETFVVHRFPELLSQLSSEVRVEEGEGQAIIFSTAEGKKRYERELARIMEEDFEKIRIEIGKALEFGDISENAELDAAREKQQQLAQRVERMQNDLARVVVINPETVETSQVSVGTRVTVENVESHQDGVYTILGPWDLEDSDNTIISHLSPVATGLLGKRAGETATVTLPGGTQAQYLVKTIENALLQQSEA